MTITMTTTFHGDQTNSPEYSSVAARLWRKNGAIGCRRGQIYMGDRIGDTSFSLDFADWKSWGEAQTAMAKEPEFQDLMKKVSKELSVSSRTMFVSYS